MLIVPFNGTKDPSAIDQDQTAKQILSKIWHYSQSFHLPNGRSTVEKVLQVPGLWRIGNDQIVLHCPENLVVAGEMKKYLENAPVHAIMFGASFFEVHVKMSWRPEIRHIGVRVLEAFREMETRGVFEARFSALVRLVWAACQQDTYESSLMATGFLSLFCKLQDWELAMDFFHFPIVLHWDNGDYNKKCGTKYSASDYHKFTRLVDGKKQSKGIQKSAFKVYDWAAKHGGGVPCDRMEFRFQGKYKKDLCPQLLVGTVEDTFCLLLPAMSRILRQVTAPDRLVFYGHWLITPPWWLKDLLDSSQWLDPNKVHIPRPRRPRLLT